MDIINVKELGKDVAKEQCVKMVHNLSRLMDNDERHQLVESHMLCNSLDEELQFYKEVLKEIINVKIQ